jgi:hypothetical protein
MTQTESYKHIFAKHVVAGWLRAVPEYREHCIFTEYPVCLDEQDHVVGIYPTWPDKGFQSIPTYEELIENELPPIVIFDVAVEREGLIMWAVEVVYKHGITNRKMKYLERLNKEKGLHVFTMDADWILNRTSRPESGYWKMEQVI